MRLSRERPRSEHALHSTLVFFSSLSSGEVAAAGLPRRSPQPSHDGQSRVALASPVPLQALHMCVITQLAA